jgi:hypothetical protein
VVEKQNPLTICFYKRSNQQFRGYHRDYRWWFQNFPSARPSKAGSGPGENILFGPHQVADGQQIFTPKWKLLTLNYRVTWACSETVNLHNRQIMKVKNTCKIIWHRSFETVSHPSLVSTPCLARGSMV